MSVASKIAALFQALTQEGLDALRPAERRRFGDLCRHWAQMAERSRRVEHKTSGAPPSGLDPMPGKPSLSARRRGA